MASSMPWATSPFTALRASGRLMVMTAKWSTQLVVDGHGRDPSRACTLGPDAGEPGGG